jgi:hypothetical protein
MSERLARDKRSSLFGLFVSDKKKKRLKHCHQDGCGLVEEGIL